MITDKNQLLRVRMKGREDMRLEDFSCFFYKKNARFCSVDLLTVFRGRSCRAPYDALASQNDSVPLPKLCFEHGQVLIVVSSSFRQCIDAVLEHVPFPLSKFRLSIRRRHLPDLLRINNTSCFHVHPRVEATTPAIKKIIRTGGFATTPDLLHTIFRLRNAERVEIGSFF